MVAEGTVTYCTDGPKSISVPFAVVATVVGTTARPCGDDAAGATLTVIVGAAVVAVGAGVLAGAWDEGAAIVISTGAGPVDGAAATVVVPLAPDGRWPQICWRERLTRGTHVSLPP